MLDKNILNIDKIVNYQEKTMTLPKIKIPATIKKSMGESPYLLFFKNFFKKVFNIFKKYIVSNKILIASKALRPLKFNWMFVNI